MYKLTLSLLFITLLTACTNTETQKPQEDSKSDQKIEQKKQIVFFGNSLTAGFKLSKSESFPMLIQQKIDSLGLDYECINAGNSGETSSGGIERVDWILSNNSPAIFVLELGANDGLRGLDVEVCKSNLQTILTKVKSQFPDVKIIITGMMVPPNMGKEYANRFQEIFGELAEENKTALVPFLLDKVSGNESLLLEDGIHPNAKGQVIVANNVWVVLKGLL